MQNLAVPRVAVWQSGSAMDLVVPNLAVPRTAVQRTVWQCHGFGRANFGSATELAVPWICQCKIWQCHG